MFMKNNLNIVRKLIRMKIIELLLLDVMFRCYKLLLLDKITDQEV